MMSAHPGRDTSTAAGGRWVRTRGDLRISAAWARVVVAGRDQLAFRPKPSSGFSAGSVGGHMWQNASQPG